MNAEQAIKTRKEFIGIVKSDKMQKTVVVEVKTLTQHAQYGKTIRRKEKFKAHDEKNESHVGDKVLIRETRPMSKDKRWRVVQIISKAASAGEGQ
ncbi:MAG: 30S ribosomal protein S17 [Candidatus Omnitrophota bacterium]